MRRLALLTVGLLLAPALPAFAKMPPFEMEVEPRGDTVHVEVMISDDYALDFGFGPPELNGLIAVFPANQVDEEGRPLLEPGTGVPLNRVEPGTYRGSVMLEPGRWAVVPFPDVSGGVAGSVHGLYPDTFLVDVEDEGSAIWTLAALGAVMAIAWRFRESVVVVLTGQRLRRLRTGHESLGRAMDA